MQERGADLAHGGLAPALESAVMRRRGALVLLAMLGCAGKSGGATEPVLANPERTLTDSSQLKAEFRAQEEARLQREAASKAAQREKRQAADAEAEDKRYWELVGGQRTCSPTWGEDRVVYEALVVYEASPERDAAIERLEECRKTAVSQIRKDAPRFLELQRKDFALDTVDLFDANNESLRGRLVATVDGSVLRVRIKGSFEGRDSQAQVQKWCDAASDFSRVVLKNSQGRFTCTGGWPGSMQKFIDFSLREWGALDPLSTEPGTKPVPSKPN